MVAEFRPFRVLVPALRTLHRPLSGPLYTVMLCTDTAMLAVWSRSIVYVVPRVNKGKPLTPALSRWERETVSLRGPAFLPTDRRRT